MGNVDSTMQPMMNNFIDVICTMARWAGIFIAIFGIYNLVSTFTEDRPEDKKKAIGQIVGGVALIALKYIIEMAGILNAV